VNPTYASVLKQCGLFRSLTEESIQLLAACARQVQYPKGTLVFAEGDPCPGIYCVSEGLVRIFKTSPAGKEHILHFAAPGMTFAEVAVLGDFPCPAHAEAAEDTACVLLPTAEFRKLILENHELCIQLLGGMARWVHHLVGLMEDLVLRDALARVAAYLLRAQSQNSAEDISFSSLLKKDIASHLNLTSETLSRSLRRLSELGTIELGDPKHIEIIDVPQLRQIAEGNFLE
jgi:CRP/FNR family transcriptional regulator, dissimilatory nitrate respiration regulator